MIALTVHSSGIIGEPLHLRGDGSAHCRTCFPVRYPATLILPGDIEIDARIARISQRVAVVENVLSDLTPSSHGRRRNGDRAMTDEPWSALDTIVFRDINGELVGIDGFDIFLTGATVEAARSAEVQDYSREASGFMRGPKKRRVVRDDYFGESPEVKDGDLR